MVTPAQRCKRNGWKVGTMLTVKENLRGDIELHFWTITGIGKQKVLGIEKTFNGKHKEEEIMPFDDNDFSGWRIFYPYYRKRKRSKR